MIKVTRIGMSYTFIRQNSYSILIGLCLGIAISVVFTPLLEDACGVSNLESNLDDYEPQLNLKEKPRKRKKEPQMLVRPRFYSTELRIRKKLFVGVLSTPATINSYGVVFNKTLAHRVDKIKFFLSGNAENEDGLQVLNLSGELSPTLFVFDVFRYIGQHWANDFDFYFIIKDTAFVKGVHFNRFIENFGVTKPVHIGLQLESNSPYCALSTGILISQSVLNETISNLNYCAKRFRDEIPDLGIGKCIRQSSNEPCSPTDEDGEQYVAYSLSHVVNFDDALALLALNDTFSNRALIFHSFADHRTSMSLFEYFTVKEIQRTKKEIKKIRKEILDLNPLAEDTDLPSWPIGNEAQFKAKERFDVIRWTYFKDGLMYLENDLSIVKEISGTDEQDIAQVVTSSVSYILGKQPKTLEFVRLLNGYRRFDPTRGMEYILDLVFQNINAVNQTKEVVKRVQGLRVTMKAELIPVSYVTENTRITLILKVREENLASVSAFLRSYVTTCLETKDNTMLILVLIQTSNKTDSFNELKSAVTTYAKKYQNSGAKLTWLGLKIQRQLEPPEFAIIDLVCRKFPTDSMFLLCRHDMELHLEFLNRVRMNTIQGSQVFFPIPFIAYHPDISNTLPQRVGQQSIGIDIKKNSGRFDSANYDVVSFYNGDYLSRRKLIDVPVVRLERDLSHSKLYESNTPNLIDFFVGSNLHIMRAVEPGLRLHYAEVDCDRSSTGDDSCLSRRSEALGTKAQLAAYLMGDNY